MSTLKVENIQHPNAASVALTLDTSGRIGIGTSTPGRTLTIQNSSTIVTAALVSNPANIAYLLFGDTDSDAQGRVQYDNSADALQLYSAGSERLRIDSSGRVGIGTSSPSDVLTVNGRIFVNGSLTTNAGDLNFGASGSRAFVDWDGSKARIGSLAGGGSGGPVSFFVNGGESARIDTSNRFLVGASSASGSARIQVRNTGSTATDGSLTLITTAAAGGDAPNSPYAVTRAVYGSACTSGGTETIRTLANREIAFIKIFYSWPSGSPEWKTGAYDYDGSTVSTTWFHQSNAGHAFTLGVSGGVLTLTQSVGVTMNMVIEIEYIDSSGLD